MIRFRIHLAERLELPRWLRIAQPVVSLVLALLVGTVFLRDPQAAYAHILRAGFLSAYALSSTLVKATPIMLCALGVTLAFRMRLWNIGAEGQLLIGAWAASGVALYGLPPTTPAVLMLPAMMAAGFLAGALWAGIAGILRTLLGVSEIITTLMMNYIATSLILYFVFGPWSQYGLQMTPQFPHCAWLPSLRDASSWAPALSGLNAHAGILVGLGAAAILALLLGRSRWGYAVRATGDNPRAARYAGLSVDRNMVLVMCLSGGLAGLAGMTEVAGVVHRLQDRFSPGYGFTGIIVAWLAKLNPWAIVLTSLLFGGLLVGGMEIQPAGIPQMLQGIVLLILAGSEILLRYQIRLVGRSSGR